MGWGGVGWYAQSFSSPTSNYIEVTLWLSWGCDNLYHVDGKENISDLGTRPDLLTVEQMSPCSEWLTGKAWMKEPVENAIENGILKKIKLF